MKTIILAGGLGTRLSEETELRPKPMVEVGGKPMLYHLLGLYARAGFDEFVIAAGYKQEVIKEYFQRFFSYNNDLYIDLRTGETTVEVTQTHKENWKVRVVDTGLATMTGGRLLRLRSLVADGTFMCTYGDGLASLDIADLVRFHRAQGRMATLTAVRPPARFGGLDIVGDSVRTFIEKPQTSEGWINGGFFVFEPAIFDRIAGDATLLEHEPLAGLAADGELSCYKHDGFWQPMDTLRDRRHLEELWATGNAPWVR